VTPQPLASSAVSGLTHSLFGLQSAGAAQLSAELHCTRQVPLLSHLYGVQSWVVPSTFFAVWSPSQVAPDMHLLEARSQELPAAQSTSFVQLSLQATAPHA